MEKCHFWFFVVPTDVDEFDAVVGDGVEGDGDVLQLVVLVLRPLVVPGEGCDDSRLTTNDILTLVE